MKLYSKHVIEVASVSIASFATRVNSRIIPWLLIYEIKINFDFILIYQSILVSFCVVSIITCLVSALITAEFLFCEITCCEIFECGSYTSGASFVDLDDFKLVLILPMLFETEL